MAISAQKRGQAFHLFCMGVSYEKIASVVGVGTRTIPRWIDKYGWREDKERLAKVAEENSKNDKEKLNEQLLESVKKVWAKSVSNSQAKASARDLIEVIKLERLVAGESTEKVEHSGSVDTGKYDLIVNFPKDFKMPKKEDIK